MCIFTDSLAFALYNTLSQSHCNLRSSELSLTASSKIMVPKNKKHKNTAKLNSERQTYLFVYQSRTMLSVFLPYIEKPSSFLLSGRNVYQSHQKKPANQSSFHIEVIADS